MNIFLLLIYFKNFDKHAFECVLKSSVFDTYNTLRKFVICNAFFKFIFIEKYIAKKKIL